MLNPCSCDAWQNLYLDPVAYALPDTVTPIQARGHVQFTTKEVLATTGQQREQWVGAGKSEVGGLVPKALQPLTDAEWNQVDELRRTCEVFPGDAVWTRKSSRRHKCRIVGLGNLLNQVGPTTVSDIDTSLFRVILAWAVVMGCTIAALDISTAFLNAPLPPERKILFFWPKCLLALGVLDSLRPAWVTAALYGIMESPS
eukprot:3760605-Amphidinium_carterae.1